MCECVSVSPCRTRTHNIPPLQTYFPLILMKLISQWDQQQVSIQFPCAHNNQLVNSDPARLHDPRAPPTLTFLHSFCRAGRARQRRMAGNNARVRIRDIGQRYRYMVISKHNLSQSVSSVNNEQLSGRHQSSGPDFRRRFSYS